mmetsp:Transcript_55445/g.154499  ORF Transcript_55445/g.154499 Transcript_55445/m.154499 type:complete len:956 (+) Transcript_55445:43-2910(+)
MTRMEQFWHWCLVTAVVFPQTLHAFLLGIDFGSQFFKAAIIAPGKPFEVVHNQHSKRKTPTAISYGGKVRTYGDDAVASAMRSVVNTPMFFPLQLGRNISSDEGSAINWMPKAFYPYKLDTAASGGIVFQIGEGNLSLVEAAGHLLGFARRLAEETVDKVPVSETVLTIPASATMLQRLSLLDAAAIAQLPRPQLVHETSAAGLQRALDLDLSGANGTEKNTSTVLFYNMGARHVEACVVGYKGLTHLGKPTVEMDVLGCGLNQKLGGHYVDIVIAQKMLEAFQAKHPKLADGIASSLRALRKLEKEAMGMKHVLSANKEAQFRVESLYEDTDFFQPVQRELLEQWCADIFATFSEPVDDALRGAGLTLDSLDSVEMIGGGWRIPKMQTLLSEYLQNGRSEGVPILNLSQHINGDEAMATGAAFYGANSSVSFRTKKVFFTDFTPHAYSLVLSPLNASQLHEKGWEHSVDLFTAGSKLRAKKTVKVNVGFDVRATILENATPVVHIDFSGVHDAASGKYAHLGIPLVSLKFELDSSGIVRASSGTAIFDEVVVVNVTESAPKPVGVGKASNASDAPKDSVETDSSPKDEMHNLGDAEDGGAASADPSTDSAIVNGSAKERGNDTIVMVTRTKIKKVKVEIATAESFHNIHPRPLDREERLDALARSKRMDDADAAVLQLDFARDRLERYIYESRTKLNDDENWQQVSTEEQRAQALERCDAAENWLYSEEANDANIDLLTEKLTEAQEFAHPIHVRATEFEQRSMVIDIVEKVNNYVNRTLQYVESNMTWVAAKEREGVRNLTAGFNVWYKNVTEWQAATSLTQEPVFSHIDVRTRLKRVQSEAERLTKIRKIDPIPYSQDYYGRYGGYDDARWRAYYDSMYRNQSGNGSYYDWLRNFSNYSNFSDWNNTEYMRSFYEHYAQNFSRNAGGENTHSSASADSKPNYTASDGTRSEL